MSNEVSGFPGMATADRQTTGELAAGAPGPLHAAIAAPDVKSAANAPKSVVTSTAKNLFPRPALY
jgi:hypothetical protein